MKFYAGRDIGIEYAQIEIAKRLIKSGIRKNISLYTAVSEDEINILIQAYDQNGSF